jgi:sulfur-oxidizing protein SoxA
MAGPFQHVRRQGQMLRGQRFSQGQSDGFPEYRLGEVASAASIGVSANALYRFVPNRSRRGRRSTTCSAPCVASRGNGLPIETPAVRF